MWPARECPLLPGNSHFAKLLRFPEIEIANMV